MYHNWYYYNQFSPLGFNLAGFIFNILFWGLLIFLIIKLIKLLVNNHYSESDIDEKNINIKDNKYIDIIKRRYAEGEITKKEFDQLKKDLV